MVDGFIDYKAVFAYGPVELACGPNRRKLSKYVSPMRASWPKKRCAVLRSCNGACHDTRTAFSPVLADLHIWLLKTQRPVLAGSGTARS